MDADHATAHAGTVRDSFLQEQRRRLKVLKEAAQEEQTQGKPFPASISLRQHKGSYHISVDHNVTFKVGQRLKIGLEHNTPQENLEPT